MGVQKQMIGVKGDECQCGRRASIRHCPSCGSARSYARMNRFHTYADGSTAKVDTEFRCQTCGHLYVDEERQFCDAPPAGAKLAAQKVQVIAEAKAKGEFLNPKDKKLADALVEAAGIIEGEVTYDTTFLKNTWFALRRAWVDLKIENKGVVELPLLDFLAKNLRESKVPENHIRTILQWQREESERLEASNG